MYTMCKPEGVSSIDTTLEREQFYKFVRKKRESIMSPPRGRHYGHLKACEQDQNIIAVLSDIMDIAFKHQVTLTRWTTAHGLLSPKDPSACGLHRMRNITIVEGDLQYVMKEIWARRLLTNADPVLLDSQNARKQKVAQSAVLGHRLGLDITRVTHSEVGMVINDGVNCYDRINLEVAFLATIRMGMSNSAAGCTVSILRNLNDFLVLGKATTSGYMASNNNYTFDGTG